MRKNNKRIKKQSEKLNWSGLNFPVELKDIKIFEKNNPGIAVNVLGYEGYFFPFKTFKNKNKKGKYCKSSLGF